MVDKEGGVCCLDIGCKDKTEGKSTLSGLIDDPSFDSLLKLSSKNLSINIQHC